MSKRLITAALVIAAGLFAATAKAEEGKMMHMKMIKSQEITMADGRKATVLVFETENGGGQLVAIPEDKIDADMHKQIFGQ